ncbi:MAG: hypothetical protein A2Y80_04470 [Deltaproteobacteria bacterium RBG_13_58_19]|nr:MAG: hypothetical protein A2Y80_04470 [Deltaproteobacteria bacterium RBG_13_58_19]
MLLVPKILLGTLLGPMLSFAQNPAIPAATLLLPSGAWRPMCVPQQELGKEMILDIFISIRHQKVIFVAAGFSLRLLAH